MLVLTGQPHTNVLIVLMQGLHIVADTYDGFSGLTSGLVEDLADLYEKKNVAVFSVSPPSFQDDVSTHACMLKEAFHQLDMHLFFGIVCTVKGAFLSRNVHQNRIAYLQTL